MALKTCRWSLDTCDCIYDQQYDPADYDGTMAITAHVRVCTAHAVIALASDRPVHAIRHMKWRNRILGRLQAAFPTELFDQQPDGTLVPKPGAISAGFSGTGVDRMLTVTLVGLSAAQRLAAQNWADTNLGAGHVLVA